MTYPAPGVRDVADALAVPLRNGAPVFDSRWQARTFGMVVGLCEHGVYDWDAFKALLIKHVGAGLPAGPARRCAGAPASSDYYTQFLAAFIELLGERELVTEAEIDARIEEFAKGERPEQYLGNPDARSSLGFARVIARP